MQGEDTSDLIAEQVQLREQAANLAARLEEANWAITATPEEATRSFFGRLIGGAQTVESNAIDTVAAYLDDADLLRVDSDINGLVGETQTLADVTLIVASADGSIDSGSLERDLAKVERALGAVRRANDFFVAVADHNSWGEDEAQSIAAWVIMIGHAETRLATAADALAERRWASRSGLFG